MTSLTQTPCPQFNHFVFIYFSLYFLYFFCVCVCSRAVRITHFRSTFRVVVAFLCKNLGNRLNRYLIQIRSILSKSNRRPIRVVLRWSVWWLTCSNCGTSTEKAMMMMTMTEIQKKTFTNAIFRKLMVSMISCVPRNGVPRIWLIWQ